MLEHEWLCSPYRKHRSEACSPEAEGTVVLSAHENQTWIDADRFLSMVLLRATGKPLLSTCDRAAFSTVVMPRIIFSPWVPSDELPFLVVFFLLLVSVFGACLPGTLVADRVVAEYVDHTRFVMLHSLLLPCLWGREYPFRPSSQEIEELGASRHCLQRKSISQFLFCLFGNFGRSCFQFKNLTPVFVTEWSSMSKRFSAGGLGWRYPGSSFNHTIFIYRPFRPIRFLFAWLECNKWSIFD